MRRTKQHATGKLRLHTETLRHLSPSQLARAAGGAEDGGEWGDGDGGWDGWDGGGDPTLTDTLDWTVWDGQVITVTCPIDA